MNSDNRKHIVVGNDNITAGRDVIEKHYYYSMHPIRFFEEDIKKVILCFSEVESKIKIILEDFDDFYRPHIEQKNDINNLSEEYFENTIKESMNSFAKITCFLEHPDNKKFLKMFLSSSKEINNKIKCHRKDFDYFEKIFDSVYTYIVESSNYVLEFDKELIWLFLHYMYYYCLIGEKYVKAI